MENFVNVMNGENYSTKLRILSASIIVMHLLKYTTHTHSHVFLLIILIRNPIGKRSAILQPLQSILQIFSTQTL